ncbi:iron-containing alcohol dehydrogenase [Dethiosulfovibrio peptidovorans DSM 11002]|uniref:Iron-containing alcohol dehydrogenase n=1 Tax=Dethiosulfovibrio peptidovorans DSM 11002 TaxID=469381 RepID=D2Z5N9_9BACT|nr:iron-containing alcohol dehydrogenase [Dethiosulfovibrio peptidovorans]EFC90786.1 iron-containing alcohol dehydrogenase [Dethiosulfovibrio peptidovorans DSM 11002]
MKNFVYESPTKIIFGKGTELQVGQEIVEKGAKKVLLHYGGGSIKKTGLYDRVVKSLEEAGVSFVELGGVVPNPRLSLVYKGIELCRNESVDLVLAVGGGSVIDSAKAIAVGVPYEGDVWDFFDKGIVPETALPVGCILTISATGSETSASSVITKEEGWLKHAFRYDRIRPTFAILNPELTITLPAYQTASGGTDIMAHLMERYFTNEPNVDLTDRLIEGTLQTVIKYLPIALKDPENYDARAELMWAATIAHNGILDTGRIGDWASHRIEHEIGAIYDVAHGAGLAVVFPAWMKAVYSHDVARFVRFFHRVWGLEPDFWNPEKTVLDGIAVMENYFRSIGMPVTLEELGVPDDRLEEMAEKSNWNGPVGQFVPITTEKALEILKLCRGHI